jgi:hypothetical protein
MHIELFGMMLAIVQREAEAGKEKERMEESIISIHTNHVHEDTLRC